MIVPILSFVLITRHRVVLKSVRPSLRQANRASATFGMVAVWVDGRNTGVRVPDWRVDPEWAKSISVVSEYSNARRDVGGELNEVYRGAMNGEYHHPFLMLKGGKFTMLPEYGDNAEAMGMDGRGRLLAIDDPPMTNFTEVCHACLWSGTEWIDLGTASTAHFERDGSIVGSFPSTRKGEPLEPIDYGGEGFRVRFRWKDGKRTESKPYQA